MQQHICCGGADRREERQAQAKGSTKKAAEQEAAYRAIMHLRGKQ